MFSQMLPTDEEILTMSPTELGGRLLAVLQRTLVYPDHRTHIGNFSRNIAQQCKVQTESARHVEALRLAVAEAMEWLHHEGYLVGDHDQSIGWLLLSAKGKEPIDTATFTQLHQDRALPTEFVHALLRSTALPLFRQNRLDTAVFEAFKTLEVEIRNAAGLGDELIGTKLASRAFNPDDGPLTDKSVEAGERQSLMNLMCGALGSYKNPHSHRRVAISPSEAREMLMLASHLLRIVDSRRASLAEGD